MFILVLEINFFHTKKYRIIKGVGICNHTFLCTIYADNSTYFSNDELAVIETIIVFDEFSLFPGLRPNKSKCQVTSKSILNGVKMTLRGMERLT